MTTSPFSKNGPVRTLHRLKMRQRVAAVGLGFVLAITGAVVATQDRADAVNGCAVPVKDKVNTMERNRTYIPPFRPPMVHAYTLKMTSTLMYWSCEYNVKPDKLRPVYWSHCWTFLDGHQDHVWFQGAWFNPRALDTSGHRSNPPGFFVPDDGTVSHCKRQYVSLKEANWLLRSANPKQTNTFKIVLKGIAKDETGYLIDRDTGKGLSYLRPAVDHTVQGKHW